MAEAIDYRRPTDADHDAVVRRFDDWAGGRTARQLLPRLWFRHFTGTSWIAARVDGRVIGIAIGYLSQDDPSVAVLHVVAVDPRHRRRGVGSELAARFVRDAATRGATTVRTTAWADDRPTIHFLEAIGFHLVEPPDRQRLYGMPAVADYDAPGRRPGRARAIDRVHRGMRRARPGRRRRRAPRPAQRRPRRLRHDAHGVQPRDRRLLRRPDDRRHHDDPDEALHTTPRRRGLPRVRRRGRRRLPQRRGVGPADLPDLRSGLQDVHRDRRRGPDRHRLPLPRADERPLGGRRPPRDVLHPLARRQLARPFVPGVLLTFDALAAPPLDGFSTISR